MLCACAAHGADGSPRANGQSVERARLDAGGAFLRDGAAVLPGPLCPSAVRTDSRIAERAACTFGPLAEVAETLAFMPTERARIPVRHVIVVMKENRSYDQLFGKLFERGQPDSEPLLDSATNLDADGTQVHPFHAATTCLPDLPHQWKALHADVHGGLMDGFVTSALRPDAMAFYDSRDLPFYYFLANTFAIADRFFPSVLSGTWPNRDYLLLGTSDHVRVTGGRTPDAALPTIFSRLTERGVSWGVFSSDPPFEGALGWSTEHPGVATMDAFFEQLADGSLPQVVFVDGQDFREDEHPPADLQVGEAWSHQIYQAARGSPLWPSLALFLTYDECGGFYDHVAPPTGCAALASDEAFRELGVRVPLLVISRFARPHFVSHVQHEHTSILRFIELLFDLPALTARDANSDALLDMFDFACPNDAIAEPPAPGSGGCP
jgi:phospholipase C